MLVVVHRRWSGSCRSCQVAPAEKIVSRWYTAICWCCLSVDASPAVMKFTGLLVIGCGCEMWCKLWGPEPEHTAAAVVQRSAQLSLHVACWFVCVVLWIGVTEKQLLGCRLTMSLRMQAHHFCAVPMTVCLLVSCVLVVCRWVGSGYKCVLGDRPVGMLYAGALCVPVCGAFVVSAGYHCVHCALYASTQIALRGGAASRS